MICLRFDQPHCVDLRSCGNYRRGPGRVAVRAMCAHELIGFLGLGCLFCMCCEADGWLLVPMGKLPSHLDGADSHGRSSVRALLDGTMASLVWEALIQRGLDQRSASRSSTVAPVIARRAVSRCRRMPPLTGSATPERSHSTHAWRTGTGASAWRQIFLNPTGKGAPPERNDACPTRRAHHAAIVRMSLLGRTAWPEQDGRNGRISTRSARVCDPTIDESFDRMEWPWPPSPLRSLRPRRSARP